MAQIVPSILAADFARLAEQIESVERGGAAMLHLDVMDGHFVPNFTIGPPVVASIRKVTRARLDVHLMIDDPDYYAPIFIQAGADHGLDRICSVLPEAAMALWFSAAGTESVRLDLPLERPVARLTELPAWFRSRDRAGDPIPARIPGFAGG